MDTSVEITDRYRLFGVPQLPLLIFLVVLACALFASRLHAQTEEALRAAAEQAAIADQGVRVGEAVTSAVQQAPPEFTVNLPPIPDEYFALLGMALALVAIIVIGIPIARAIARRIEGRGSARLDDAVVSRLDRIEQSVDAIAVEVERVTEGQRFTAKLLDEKIKEAVR